MKARPRLYWAFNICFGVFFIGLCIVSIFWHDNPFVQMKKSLLLGTTVTFLVVALGAVILWQRIAWPLHHEIRTIVVLMTLYLLLQLLFGWQMQVGFDAEWDYPIVAKAAEELVLHGVPPGEYFALFSNNGPLFWFYTGYFHLLYWFGSQDFVYGLIILNSLMIDLSFFFLYLTARQLWGKRGALPLLGAAMLCPAFLLYVPIAYTDTLTLPFVTGAAWLWLCARSRRMEGLPSGRWVAGALALTALGAVLKMSVAVLAFAFALDLLVWWDGRGRLRLLAIGAACFATLWTGVNFASRAAMPPFEEKSVPFTHWIMMGLHGNGGYWDPDYELTLQYDTYEERLVFTQGEILRRLKEMGTEGLAKHCVAKLSYIISDGTCYAPEKLDRNHRGGEALNDFILKGGKYSSFLYYGADGLQLCLLALCAVGSFLSFPRQQQQVTVFRIGVFGLLLFLLLWEARSRYLVNFLPLLLLCAADGLASFYKRQRHSPDAISSSRKEMRKWDLNIR